jgi:hypothetical protein
MLFSAVKPCYRSLQAMFCGQVSAVLLLDVAIRGVLPNVLFDNVNKMTSMVMGKPTHLGNGVNV